jgi:hypothetical protein
MRAPLCERPFRLLFPSLLYSILAHRSRLVKHYAAAPEKFAKKQISDAKKRRSYRKLKSQGVNAKKCKKIYFDVL